MSTRRRDNGFSPAMESELRKIEAKRAKSAQEDYAAEHSPYGDWKRSLHANLYADSGDPDRPARSLTALPSKASQSPASHAMGSVMTFEVYKRNRRDESKARHGTPSGYSRHQEINEDPCPACYAAKADYDKRQRSAPERTRKNRMHARAQTRALMSLKRKYPDEYRALYAKYKAEIFAEDGAA